MLAVGDTVALCSKVDGFVFLVELNVARRPQLERAAEQFTRMPCRLLGIILARGKEVEGAYYYYGYGPKGPPATPHRPGRESLLPPVTSDPPVATDLTP